MSKTRSGIKHDKKQERSQSESQPGSLLPVSWPAGGRTSVSPSSLPPPDPAVDSSQGQDRAPGNRGDTLDGGHLRGSVHAMDIHTCCRLYACPRLFTMVMGHPFRGSVTVQINRQEQTCPSLAKGWAPPQAMNSMFCNHDPACC